MNSVVEKFLCLSLAFTGAGVMCIGVGMVQTSHRVTQLESVVYASVGQQWPTLTPVQRSQLIHLVEPLPRRKLAVVYGNALGIPLANDIADAFRTAGWQPEVSQGLSLESGIGTGWGNGMALTLKDALEDATGWKVRSYLAESIEDPNFVFVGVGVRR